MGKVGLVRIFILSGGRPHPRRIVLEVSVVVARPHPEDRVGAPDLQGDRGDEAPFLDGAVGMQRLLLAWNDLTEGGEPAHQIRRRDGEQQGNEAGGEQQLVPANPPAEQDEAEHAGEGEDSSPRVGEGNCSRE